MTGNATSCTETCDEPATVPNDQRIGCSEYPTEIITIHNQNALRYSFWQNFQSTSLKCAVLRISGRFFMQYLFQFVTLVTTIPEVPVNSAPETQ